MLREFFKVKGPDEVLKEIQRFHAIGEEVLPIQEALGRVLAEAGISKKEALKALDRARREIYG